MATLIAPPIVLPGKGRISLCPRDGGKLFTEEFPEGDELVCFCGYRHATGAGRGLRYTWMLNQPQLKRYEKARSRNSVTLRDALMKALWEDGLVTLGYLMQKYSLSTRQVYRIVKGR